MIRKVLPLTEEREAKLEALRLKIDRAIAEGGVVGDDELDQAIAEKSAALNARTHRR